MKRFSFRLDNILIYRDYLEKKAQRDLLDARNEYKEMKSKVKRLTRKRIANEIKCRNEAVKGLDVPMYQIYGAFRQKVDHDLERAYTDLREGAKKVKAKEEILKRESIKKKALETLKDLQLKNYMKKLEQEEQKFIDEMVEVRRGGKA